MELASKASCQWLGKTMSYAPDWQTEYDDAFSRADASWHANRKWMLNCQLTARKRITIFAQTAAANLVSRLAMLPLTRTVLHRVRRWENRAIRMITGIGFGPACSRHDLCAWTRKARKVADRLGHVCVVRLVLQRHHRVAGQWARLDSDRGDRAISHFFGAWFPS